MANIWENDILILAGNLNPCRSYLITTVHRRSRDIFFSITVSQNKIAATNFKPPLFFLGWLCWSMCNDDDRDRVLWERRDFCKEQLSDWATTSNLGGVNIDNTGFKTGSGSQYSVVGSCRGTEIGIQLSASSLTSSPFFHSNVLFKEPLSNHLTLLPQ